VEELEKIDILRKRTGLRYKEAKETLDEYNWDIIETLIALENKDDLNRDRLYVKGSELVEQVKKIIHEGNINKLRVKHKGRVIVELPLTVGALGVLLAPSFAVLGTIAILFSQATLEIEKDREVSSEEEMPAENFQHN